ncbi:MAG: hypothetical protein WBZ36_07315, partial [Candidatus Nitrosopolaris sp.]
DDLSKFQKTMEDIFKQKQISQREYFIQKIKEEQEHADLNIKSGSNTATSKLWKSIYTIWRSIHIIIYYLGRFNRQEGA